MTIHKKHLLFALLIITAIFPAISAYFVWQNLITEGIALNNIEQSIIFYQLSVWIIWINFVSVSIYHKWTTGKNLFFIATYSFLVVGFAIFGFFIQEMVNLFDLRSTFEDTYSLGVFTALLHFVVAAILTGFLQAAVWWFTRRWHRR